MKRTLVLFFLVLFFSKNIFAQGKLYNFEEEKGIFSLGLSGGIAKSGLLNTNSNFSGYDLTNFGFDVDFRLWGMGPGEFRMFVSYLVGEGKGNSVSSDIIKTEETVLGVKINIGSNLYLSFGAGPGKINLSSSSNSAEIKMTQILNRVSIGGEFPLTSRFYLGADLSYKNAPIKRSENPTMSENSYYEGSAFMLRFIWSPPSVTNTFISK